jgi:hypothetical protein
MVILDVWGQWQLGQLLLSSALLSAFQSVIVVVNLISLEQMQRKNYPRFTNSSKRNNLCWGRNRLIFPPSPESVDCYADRNNARYPLRYQSALDIHYTPVG